MDNRLTLTRELEENYCNLAIIQRNALSEGNKKEANRAYNKLKKLFDKMQIDIDTSACFLLDLLRSNDPRISSWAASHSLGLNSNIDEAEGTLKEISSRTDVGVLRSTAEMTLLIWREQGYLTF